MHGQPVRLVRSGLFLCLIITLLPTMKVNQPPVAEKQSRKTAVARNEAATPIKQAAKRIVVSEIDPQSMGRRSRLIRSPLSSRGYHRSRRSIVMCATGYDPSPASCGPRATGYTACGMKAGYGVVAVDPKCIPLRTRLYIEGYGFAIAGDTGGAIKGHRIDLGFDTREAALGFGRRQVVVHVLG